MCHTGKTGCWMKYWTGLRRLLLKPIAHVGFFTFVYGRNTLLRMLFLMIKSRILDQSNPFR